MLSFFGQSMRRTYICCGTHDTQLQYLSWPVYCNTLFVALLKLHDGSSGCLLPCSRNMNQVEQDASSTYRLEHDGGEWVDCVVAAQHDVIIWCEVFR